MFDDQTEALIEKFFDDNLTSEEKERFDALIASDNRLKHRIQNDAMLRSLFQRGPRQNFRPAFSENVVQKITGEAALGKLLSAHKASSFSSRFEGHIMKALDAEAQHKGKFIDEEIGEALNRLFPKVAAPVALAISLAVVSNINAAAAGAPLIDTLLGLSSEETFEFSLMVFGQE